jgi:hypothetical protein
MRILNFAILGTMSLVCPPASAAEPLPSAARKAAWQQFLEEQEYEFDQADAMFFQSLRDFKADAKVQITYDPERPRELEYSFVREGRAVVSYTGSIQSTFAGFGDKLYVARSSRAASGCTIKAYDLKSGEELWSTELHHARPGGHSGYRNLVTIWCSSGLEVKDEKEEGTAILIMGRESYCDYIEVLDPETGESLALKNFRVGF